MIWGAPNFDFVFFNLVGQTDKKRRCKEKNISILIFKTFIDVDLELFSVERAGARH